MFGYRNVYAAGEILIGVQKYLMIFVYRPFPLKTTTTKKQQKGGGSSVVSRIKSELLLFVVNIAVTQQTFLRSWLTCCRRLQKAAFCFLLAMRVLQERGCCQLPGREALLQARGCNVSANSTKDTALRLCQSAGCSTCAGGTVFCICVYCFECLFFLD